jgi:hypothetical protein
MYGTLSLKIFEFILSSGKWSVHIPVFDMQASDRCISRNTSYKITEFDDARPVAIRVLPFYLSNADYMPELAAHARSLRTHEIVANHDTLDSEIKFLHEAIDQYLTVSLEILYPCHHQTFMDYIEDTSHTECIPGAVQPACA